MNITEDDSDATYHIQRYEPGEIWINKQRYENSVIVRPHALQAWEPKRIDELKTEHFDAVFSPKVDIVLLGTGAKLIVPATSLLRKLYEAGIGVEFMDSKAACRTYTVLAAESRNVAACILIL